MKVTIVPIVIGAFGTITKGLLKGLEGGLGSWRRGRYYPNNSIAENGQKAEKSPGVLRRLAVTQTPVRNHQGVNNNNNNNNNGALGTITDGLIKGHEGLGN